MDIDPKGDEDGGDQAESDLSTEAFLEALLVDDAAIAWDPVTGRPMVARRPKITLDSPPDTAYDRP